MLKTSSSNHKIMNQCTIVRWKFVIPRLSCSSADIPNLQNFMHEIHSLKVFLFYCKTVLLNMRHSGFVYFITLHSYTYLSPVYPISEILFFNILCLKPLILCHPSSETWITVCFRKLLDHKFDLKFSQQWLWKIVLLCRR